MQYNCLIQKYDKLKEDYQQVLTASLRFREEQIEKVNKMNDMESEYALVFYFFLPKYFKFNLFLLKTATV